MTNFNPYGDKFRPTDGGHGVDIASQRQDELDIESLAYIAARTAAGEKTGAVDLGGGFGVHAVRMAEAGAEVTMIDIEDMATSRFHASSAASRLRFVQKDFAALSESDFPANFDVLYSIA